MKNEAKLVNLGLKGKEKYYHWHAICVGVATVCLIPVGETGTGRTQYVRGIAYCNPKDQFVKKLGRAIALGRAVQAIEKHGYSEPISDDTPAVSLRNEWGWGYLSQWDIELTNYEKGIFGKPIH